MNSHLEKTYFTVGGGLGDCINVYCASPKSYSEQGDDIFSTDLVASIWFRRLNDFKSKNRNTKIQLVITSHSLSAENFFKNNPYLDEIKFLGWPAKFFDRQKYGIQPINQAFNFKEFEPSPVEFFLTEEQKKLLKELLPKEKFVVIHPFARKSEREISLHFYCELIKELANKGIKSVVIGANNKVVTDDRTDNIREDFGFEHPYLINLVNKIDVSMVPHFIINASGFIGTHSCWILLAWWKKLKTLCLVPDIELFINGRGFMSWREWKKSDPYIWGLNKDFNKTIWIKEWQKDFDYKEAIDFLI